MAPAPTARFTKALKALSPDDDDALDAELIAFLFATLREAAATGEPISFTEEVLASFLPSMAALDPPKRAALVASVASAAAAGLPARTLDLGAAPDPIPTAMGAALLALQAGGGGGVGGCSGGSSKSASTAGGGGGSADAPLSAASAFPTPPHLRAAADTLCALLPQLCTEAACIALERAGAGSDADRAAAWLLAGGPALEEEVCRAADAAATRRGAAAAARAADAAAAQRAEEAARRQTLKRFDEAPDARGVTHVPLVAFAAPPKKGVAVLRYVEGQAVHLRPGEKFIVEKGAEPVAGTVVALKIKKKGQGGASPGFK